MKLKRILAGIMTAALVITSVPTAGLGSISAQAAGEVTYEKISSSILAQNAFANSEQCDADGNPSWTNDGPASYAFNDNTGNWWHSRYEHWDVAVEKGEAITDAETKATVFTEGGPTVYIGSSFNEEISLGMIKYQGRTGDQAGSNTIGDFKLWVADMEDPTAVPAEGDWKVAVSSVEVEGAEKADTFADGNMQTVILETPVKATHFKLEALSLAASQRASDDAHCVTASVIEVYKAVGEEPEPEVTEKIYYPDEDGNFNIPETDMEFFNSMSDMQISVVYRYTDVEQTTASKGYALFTLEGADGKFLTVRHVPIRSDNAANGEIAYAYDGSATGLKFGNAGYKVNNTEWHKLTFSLSESTMDIRHDTTIYTWNVASSYWKDGILGEDNNYTAAYIGEIAKEGAYADVGIYSALEDFPGEIKYVKITKEAYNADTLAADHASVKQENAAALTALLDECEGLDAESYTEDSWAALETAKAAADTATTEWAVLNAIDALEAAIAGLEEKVVTPEEKALEAALEAAAAIDDNGKTYTEESKQALAAAVAQANALGADASTEDIVAATEAILAAIEDLAETWAESVAYEGTLTIVADSEETVGEGATNGFAKAAIDGDVSTFWHSQWYGLPDNAGTNIETGTDEDGNTILVGNNNVYLTLEEPKTVSGISYVPRLKNGAMSENGAVTRLNVYVSTDGGETYELAEEKVEWSYDGWNYNNDGAKTAEFKSVEGVTDIKLEVLNTTSTQSEANKNQFINAAEIGVLVPEGETKADERTKISAPNIILTAPEAGKAPAEAVGDSYTPASLVDGAEQPITLSSSNVKIEAGEDGNTFSGQISAASATTKLNTTNPFVINFDWKTEALSNGSTQSIIGMFDNLYGVQLSRNDNSYGTVVQVYCCDSSNAWPTLRYPLPEGFDWDAWHNVKAVYNGTTFILVVDGQAMAYDGSFALANIADSTSGKNIFGIGYNAGKSASSEVYGGQLRNVKIYTDESLNGVAADGIDAAIADLAPVFEVVATPESGVTPNYDIISTVWTNQNGEEITKFVLGEENTVTVTLEAKDGYKFTEPTSLPAVTVDGETVEAVVEITDNAKAGTSIMTISYTFAVSEDDAKALAINNCLDQLIRYYGCYQESAETDILRMLDALAELDETKAEEWQKIMDYWRYINSDEFSVNTITYDDDGAPSGVPEGLADDNTLCIVVLGFQLNPDGSMKDELIGRLNAAYAVAQAYPNAYVACTGGGTASENPNATEADQMADYLINTKGIDANRVIVENKSKTTVQNAQFTYAILRTSYPEVNDLCMVTSDYHVQRGSLLYFSKCLLSAYEAGDKELAIVSNAGYAAGHEGYESILLQMAGVSQIAEISLTNEEPTLSVVTDIEVSGIKNAYELGEELGELKVTASYDTNYSRDVSEKAVVSGYDKDTEGRQTVTVTYEENGTTVTKELKVSVGDVTEKIEAPTVAFTAPVAGEYPEVAAVTSDANSVHYEDIADRAAEPAELVKINDSSVAEIVNQDGVWGFMDQLKSTSAHDKFDVSGETPLIVSLKLYVKDAVSGNLNILGKTDTQYGFQIESDCLILYCASADGGWPEHKYALDSDFYGKWHDIVLAFDGNTHMAFFVDGEASTATEGRPTSATLASNENPFTIGYNYDHPENIFTSEHGYIADVKIYTTDVTEKMTNDGAVIRNLLDLEAPIANITATPYDVQTTWGVTDGDTLDGKTAFGEHTSYTATTVITAHDGYAFENSVDFTNEVARKAAEASEGANVKAVVSEDGTSVTITASFEATTTIACTCGVSLTVKANETINLDENYTAQTKQLTANAVATGSCKVEGHPNTSAITYAVTKGSDVVSVDEKGVVTTKTVGEAEITVTATLAKKEGEEPATDSKVIKVTVLSSRASDELVESLETAVRNREAEIAGDLEKTYTAESVEELKAAIAAAKELLAKKPAVTTSDVRNKLNALNNVTLKSQQEADIAATYKALGDLIDTANEKISSGEYTYDTAKALEAVNIAAVELYNRGIANVTLEELNKACAELQAALDGLVTKADQEIKDKEAAKTALKAALAGAEAIAAAGQSTYTDATWKAFKTAYDAAKAGVDNGALTAAQLKALTTALTNAQKALVKEVVSEVKNGYEEELASGRYQVISTTKKTAKLVRANTKNKKKASIAIPATVTIKGVKYKVVQVGAKAFKGFTGLKKIAISKNITTIGKQAFAGCKKLSSVVVKGTALKKIQTGAFKNTSKKITVTFKSKKVTAKKRAALLKKMKKAGMSKSAKLK